MDYYLALIVLSVTSLAYSTKTCQFESEAIQVLYDQFELFRKTKAFDPTDSKVPLQHYQFYICNGVKQLTFAINGVYMEEDYDTNNADNTIQTERGQYRVKDGVYLNYERDENGAFSFDDWSNNKKFKSSLRSIDAELPSDFEEDYKQVLVDLNAMRKKMFDYKNGLSKEDFKRVRLFECTPFPNGGFYAQFIDNEKGTLYVSKSSHDISGRLVCENQQRNFNTVDGKVVTDVEPFPHYFRSLLKKT